MNEPSPFSVCHSSYLSANSDSKVFQASGTLFLISDALANLSSSFKVSQVLQAVFAFWAGILGPNILVMILGSLKLLA
jgi:hypothetical protein